MLHPLPNISYRRKPVKRMSFSTAVINMLRVVPTTIFFGLCVVALAVGVWLVGDSYGRSATKHVAVLLHQTAFSKVVDMLPVELTRPYRMLLTVNTLAAGKTWDMQTAMMLENAPRYSAAICAMAFNSQISGLAYVTTEKRSIGCYTAQVSRVKRAFFHISPSNLTIWDCTVDDHNDVANLSDCVVNPNYDPSAPGSAIAWDVGTVLQENQREVVGPLVVYQKPGIPMAFKYQYVTPVFDHGTRVGFWKADLYTEALQLLSKSLASIAPNSVAYVVDEPSLQLIVSSMTTVQEVVNATTADPHKWPFLCEIMSLQRPSKSKESQRSFLSGQAVYVTSQISEPVPGLRVRIIAITPERQLLLALENHSRAVMALSVGLSIVMSILLVLLLWLSLAKPLRVMSDYFGTVATSAPTSSHFLLPFDVEKLPLQRRPLSIREMWRLQESFLTMVAHLRGYVSELKLMTDRATLVGEERMQFLSVMSHEIRTPLNAIICSVNHLAFQTGYTQDQWESINLMKASSEHLLTMLNNILDLTKITASELQLENCTFSVRDEIGMAVQTVTPLFTEKNLELVTFVDRTVPNVLIGDALRLRQVLVNLLTNSCKFTLQGHVMLEVLSLPPSILLTNPHLVSVGEIDLKGTDDRERVWFVVSDTGVGIPKHKLPQVFDRFKQCHQGNTRQFAGVGLGLTITAELCKLMGGGIAVDSTETEGSCFTVTLPFSIPLSIRPQSTSMVSGTECVILPHIDGALVRARFHATLMTIEKFCNNNSISVLRLPCSLGNTKSPQDLRLMVAVALQQLHATTGFSKEKTLLCIPAAYVPYSGVWESLTQGPVQLLVPLTSKDQPPPARCRQLLVPFTPSSLIQALSLHQPSSPLPTSPLTPASIPILHVACRALLVDDSPVNLTLLTRILTKMGCSCEAVLSGEDAVELFRSAAAAGNERRFDLILMDIQMPGMDGNEATRQIREIERVYGSTPATPIVACTAHAFSHDRQLCLAAGMNDYITKPYDVNSLHSTIAKFLFSGSDPQPPPIPLSADGTTT
eukprot:TRINITY_DN2946_c0_g1_i1.p1 TRINITY_DN2946_c0_g1~~TRINITY_DN2946_c0_g1_i1.p1  ORF type:complete len:1038 (-),score=123.39 TRINITY_DN2946_c0_g1_i1:18-3131(-)